MDFLSSFLDYILPFLIVLTILVFIHELGHYLVARYNGVRVEVFSIGFGPELFGFHDRHKTRWKFSLIPLGGYVKMYGDENPASQPSGKITKMSKEDKALTLHHKTVGQRIAISFAGPLANYLFAILVFTGLFATYGKPILLPKIGKIVENSPAAQANLKENDLILKVDDKDVRSFEGLVSIIKAKPEADLVIRIRRDQEEIDLVVRPEAQTYQNIFGTHKTGYIGIGSSGDVEKVVYGVFKSLWVASCESLAMSWAMLKGIGEIITGQRSTKELGGILKIAKFSGDSKKKGGYLNLLWFMAFLSINLGLINLLPIPVFDGGHILMYTIEGIIGRPLNEKMVDYAFRIGFIFIIGLLLLTTINDIIDLEFFKGLPTLFKK